MHALRRGRRRPCRGRLGWALVGLLLAAPSQAQPGWKTAGPDYAWSFPADHWAHPGYRTEWWYFTGHLVSEEPEPRQFGYQFTLFRVGIVPTRPELSSDWAAPGLIMGHAAVTDLSAGEHCFSELLLRDVPVLGGFDPDPSAGGRIAWARAPAGTDTTWSLRFNGEAFDFFAADSAAGLRFDLSTRPERPLVLQGPNGYSRKGERGDAASLYYSFTRLRTHGTLRIGGREFRVAGRSWMDKEFGSGVLGEHQSGWDWFSLQLEDGRDLMLYLLRDRTDRVDFARGTLIEAGGGSRILERGDFAVQAIGRWKSPATGATYPAGWRISIPGAAPPLDLVVEPLAADQENRCRLAGGLFYWEGAVLVRSGDGVEAGRGYVELTGYGTMNRPAL